MNNIKFSNKYYKMYNNRYEELPKDTKLLEVLRCKSEDLHKEFILYDTQIVTPRNTEVKKYKLPKGEVIILFLFSIFDWANRGMLWTTIRRYTPEKHDYYRKSRGKTFNIEMIK